jgi:hypothetical protein
MKSLYQTFTDELYKNNASQSNAQSEALMALCGAIESRLSALESRSKLANCVDVEEFYKDEPDQPVKTPSDRNEGVIYGLNLAKTIVEREFVYWSFHTEQERPSLDKINSDIEAMKQEFAPGEVEGKWQKFDDIEVWWLSRSGGVRRISMHSLVHGDLWQPVIPGEPQPKAPEAE